MFLHFLLYATLLQQTTFAISYPVTKRSDLPTIPTTCPGIQLYWNEQIISELGFVALLLQTYHSGVTAKLLPSSKPECNNMPLLNANGMTLEYVAINFPIGAILPQIKDNNLPVWSNQAVVQFSTDMHSGIRRNWTDSHFIGTMTPQAFNDWMNYPVEFGLTHPFYQLFDVWTSAVSPSTKFISGSVCTTFSVNALIAAYNSNGNVDFASSADQILYRNYLPMITETTPIVLEVNDTKQLQEINSFYAILNDLAQEKINSLFQFVERLRIELKDRLFIVYQRNKDVYHGVSLASPYLGVVGIYQPMVLPWQQVSVPSCPVQLPVSIVPSSSSHNENTISIALVVFVCIVSILFGGSVVFLNVRRKQQKRGLSDGYMNI